MDVGVLVGDTDWVSEWVPVGDGNGDEVHVGLQLGVSDGVDDSEGVGVGDNEVVDVGVWVAVDVGVCVCVLVFDFVGVCVMDGEQVALGEGVFVDVVLSVFEGVNVVERWLVRVCVRVREGLMVTEGVIVSD